MDKDFRHQFVVAENIKKRNMKNWSAKAKKYIPTYVADYLFGKSGKVEEMLKFNEQSGFEFDPEMVGNASESVLLMLEDVERNHPEKFPSYAFDIKSAYSS